MKRFLICLLVGLNLLACSKDSDDEKVSDEYYVKYHFVGSNTARHFVSFEITYTNEQLSTSKKVYGANTTAFHGSTRYEDEIICGPFKYNDMVKLSMRNLLSVNSQLLEIYVSKNNSPFALKKSSNSSSVSYSIDY